MDSDGFRISNLKIVGNPNAAGTPDGILFGTELPNDTKLPYIFITNVTVSGFRGQGGEQHRPHPPRAYGAPDQLQRWEQVTLLN
jgi:hypothetical protein